MKAFVAAAVAGAAALVAQIATTVSDAQTKRSYSGPQPSTKVQSNEIRAGNRVIGSDPDPFIRGEILRHMHSGWPD